MLADVAVAQPVGVAEAVDVAVTVADGSAERVEREDAVTVAVPVLAPLPVPLAVALPLPTALSVGAPDPVAVSVGR